MRKIVCDSCGESLEKPFCAEEIHIKGGWITIAIASNEDTEPELCRPCVNSILTDYKHPMRDLLEKKP